MIEMMVVLVIIGVLIAGGIRFYAGYIENAKVTKAKASISMMQAAMDAYFAENGAYPTADTLISTGIKATGENPFTSEQNDPWGKHYIIKMPTATSYDIYTEHDQVQGAANTVVKGHGEAGSSDLPLVGTKP